MQVRRRPWLTLLACVAAVGAARAQGTQQDVASAPAEAPAPRAPGNAAVPPPGRNWRLAPIFTSGSISYDLRSGYGGDLPRTTSQLVTSSVNAATYIYQPWLATVNGTLGLTVGRSQTEASHNPAENSFAADHPIESKDRFLTGRARVDLFPRSRFPFEAHFERSDSRVTSGLASTFDYQMQNFGFSQRYEPLNRAYAASANYDRRETIGARSRDSQDQLGAEFNTRWKHSDLSVGLALAQARRQESDERSQFRSLVGRHHYEPDKTLSINTNMNATQTIEQMAAQAASNLSVLQMSSVGLWQREGSKLQLSGSARGLLARNANGGQSVASGGLTVGANYELSRNARLSASVAANATNSAGMTTQVLTGNAAANWQGDSLEYKGLRYDYFAGGNAGVSNASGSSASETQMTLGAQLGHTISRSWQLPLDSSLSLNAGQSLGASTSRSSRTQEIPSSHGSEDTLGDQAQVPSTALTLLHTLGATWSLGGEARSAYARASYSDSMQVGGDQARFQIFNFQLSGNFAFDRNKSLNGDLTFQRSAQSGGDLQRVVDSRQPTDRSRSGGVSGSLTYSDRRLFGIPRLRFSSQLHLARDVLNQPGTLATLPDRETRVWENRLEWLVGRLESQLVYRLAEVEGKRRGNVTFRLQRSFGN
jgi:hypothetical protein